MDLHRELLFMLWTVRDCDVFDHIHGQIGGECEGVLSDDVCAFSDAHA